MKSKDNGHRNGSLEEDLRAFFGSPPPSPDTGPKKPFLCPFCGRSMGGDATVCRCGAEFLSDDMVMGESEATAFFEELEIAKEAKEWLKEKEAEERREEEAIPEPGKVEAPHVEAGPIASVLAAKPVPQEAEPSLPPFTAKPARQEERLPEAQEPARPTPQETTPSVPLEAAKPVKEEAEPSAMPEGTKPVPQEALPVEVLAPSPPAAQEAAPSVPQEVTKPVLQETSPPEAPKSVQQEAIPAGMQETLPPVSEEPVLTAQQAAGRQVHVVVQRAAVPEEEMRPEDIYELEEVPDEPLEAEAVPEAGTERVSEAGPEAGAEPSPEAAEDVFEAEESTAEAAPAISLSRLRRDRALFYVGASLLLVGGPVLLFSSFLHDIFEVPVMGDTYTAFGWLNQTVAFAGLVLLAIGIVLLAISLRGGVITDEKIKELKRLNAEG